MQGQGGQGAGPFGGAVLAQSDLVPQTNAPSDSPSLANSSEEESPFSERGHPLWMKIVESKDVLRIKRFLLKNYLQPKTILIASHLKCSASRHVKNSNAFFSAAFCLDRPPASPRAGVS